MTPHARFHYGHVVLATLCVTETVSWGISGAMSVGSTMARAAGPVASSLLLAGLGSYPRVFWVLAASLVIAGGGVMLMQAETAASTETASDPL